MGEKRGTKALELWCRRITDGYPGVNVQNMTTSWRDGLAFCAMIHHFRPDLIDFDSLDKNDVQGNNELAFRMAEQHLGIPALLDAEDMATCSVPDRLSILTYLSQFYQTFGGSSPARHLANKTTENTEERISQVPESPKEKEPPCLDKRKDLCAVCGLPIFLAEKLVLAHVSYHRTCFRCARCKSQLTLGNYYETEGGQYCCETCPDEETSSLDTDSMHSNGTVTILNQPDESYQEYPNDNDGMFKSEFIENLTKEFERKDSAIPHLIAQTSQLRLNFMSSQLHQDKHEDPVIGNDLPINDDLSSPQEACGKLETNNENVQNSVNDDVHYKQNAGKIKNNYSLNRLKPETYSDTNFKETTDKGLDKTHNISSDDVFVKNSDQKPVKELLKVLHRDDSGSKAELPNHSRKKSTETDVPPSSSFSQLQRKWRMFESREDCVDGDKIEHENLKVSKTQIQPVVDENTKNTITIPNKVETISNDVDHFTDETKGFDAEESASNSEVVSELLLSNIAVVSEDSSLNVSDQRNEDKSTSQSFVDSHELRSEITSNSDDDYPENLNPFKSDDEEELSQDEKITSTPKGIKDSTNPFESDEEVEVKVETEAKIIPPKPVARNTLNTKKNIESFHPETLTKRRLAAPKISLNPFFTNEDDCDSDLECVEQSTEFTPVPKPRTIKDTQETSLNGEKLNHSYLHKLNSSSRSSISEMDVGGAYKKKKQAPLPPDKKEGSSDQATISPAKSIGNLSGHHSYSILSSTPKARKAKPAPPPPITVSSTCSPIADTTLSFKEVDNLDISHNVSMKQTVWEDEKTGKDEANRNRQSSGHVSREENYNHKSYHNKSMEGKWKRKKGPAPPCPVPHRRKIKVMSLQDVKLELAEIEMQQRGLEKQGVRLEQLIRSKCESGSRNNDIAIGPDVEELVLELFGLVNEKNELFRRQAELMLLRRQQRLEEEHAEVEYQIRCLMSQNESTKTDSDKQREEALIQRLVEIVERRNEIVDCLEMDRRREVEEDRSIHTHMDLFSAKSKSETSAAETSGKKKRKQNKLSQKAKDLHIKRLAKKDIDKDIDEAELKLKRHTKSRWF